MSSPARRPQRFAVGSALLYVLAFFAMALARWVGKNFDHPSIEQIVYHLRFNEGLVSAGGGFFAVSFAVECIAAPLLLGLLCAYAERVFVHFLPGRLGTDRLSLWVSRATPFVPVILCAIGAQMLWVQISAPAYARSLLGQDYFSRAYVEPSAVQLRPRDPKSLLLIYVESLETAYGHRALFGEDLLAGLRTINGSSFSEYLPAPGAGWTMGGIVATQCGVPLKVMTVFDWKDASEEITHFLPRAVCLGDVLKRFGYRNVFMGGARLGFAGKGEFLAQHGYDERYGRSEWFRQGAGIADMNDWGLYDDVLFERAMAKLEELQRGGQRFNLTLLTLDTHHAYGFYSRRCKREGVTEFAGIVACTARQVGEFVRAAQGRGLLKDTRVVIMGDHLAMPNPVYEKLQQMPKRTIYNAFAPADAVAKTTERVLPFDMYPTILQFLGIEVVGGKLGLGFGAMGAPADPRRSDQELESLLAEVTSPSPRYEALWRPD